MKKYLSIICLCILSVFITSCEKTEFGYIESLKETTWQHNDWIFEFKSNSQLIWQNSKTTYTDLTWSCSETGNVNIYWNAFIGSGPYMTGNFDKYKGSLIIDGEKYKLIHQ